MLRPSIDLSGGNAVQLIGGESLALDAGDPLPLMERFARCGSVAVVDLDGALGRGHNLAMVRKLARRGRVVVGGGIRTVELARDLLDAGAEQLMIGTCASPEFLAQLPRERLIAALDAREGEVVVQGWTTGAGESVPDRMERLKPYVAGFLVTVVEREGREVGADIELARELRRLAPEHELILAGGVTTPAEIAELDKLGVDAQVGMSLYRGTLDLAEALCAPLCSDRPDGLWPTLVCDESQRALGLVYSSLDSVRRSVETGRGWYQSRKRGLWEKGATSGATQEVLRIELDCDRDALRFVVRQKRAFCHTGTRSCFGDARGLAALEQRIDSRAMNAAEGSYTNRLLEDPALLRAKLVEEASELALASTPEQVAHEAADLLYFALARCRSAGVRLDQVEAELDLRSKRVRRRRGDAKVLDPLEANAGPINAGSIDSGPANAGLATESTAKESQPKTDTEML